MPADIRFVESWPVETSLDNPDIPDAADVWLSLIQGSTRSIDFAQFYVSTDPGGKGRLRPIIDAVQIAARRGVRVRFLAEEKFYRIYPETLDELAAVPGITVRRLDSAAFNGGVLHAKYFIVDSETACLGSQNFDWRALEHIQELGVLVSASDYVCELEKVFEFDWAIAGRVEPGSGANGSAVDLVDRLRREYDEQAGPKTAMEINHPVPIRI